MGSARPAADSAGRNASHPKQWQSTDADREAFFHFEPAAGGGCPGFKD